MTVRVCVVENEALVRQGLVRLLELDPGVVVVGEARDGREALQLIEEQRPDVVLLDVRMPGMGGLDVLAALARRPDSPPCLLLTTFDDPEVLLHAVRAGARGYLLKDVSLDVLSSAIHCVAAGGSFVKPAMTDQILRGLEGVAAHPEIDDVHERLTEREQEVLGLLGGGYSNAEIAQALSVAERTVKNHVSSVLGKLHVRDRTRAVLKALRLGLL
ncbi:MAG TPA: response regulator transcription factor [Kofleriaceae bacterium]|nr:response regulator transcription factor [Kofleriaceae bacterium]